jgi:hypothetical protein
MYIPRIWDKSIDRHTSVYNTIYIIYTTTPHQLTGSDEAAPTLLTREPVQRLSKLFDR